MKKLLPLLFLSITMIACKKMTEEDRLIHNQKVISGIEKKKKDLDKIIDNIDLQTARLSEELLDVQSFKIGRAPSTKQQQLSDVDARMIKLKHHKKRTEKLRGQLDLLHTTFEWQKDPKLVLEKLFEIARRENYGTAIFLADPYDENDSDIDGIAYIASHNKETKKQFIQTFSNGRIIGMPEIKETTAKIEFLFGPHTDRKETMNFVKRNEKWYLSSF